MSSIHVHELTAHYGSLRVLHGLDLDIEDGQVGAVLGPSGSGKTTLLRVIAGLHRPTSGRVQLGSVEVSGAGNWVPPERRRVGLVPQSGSLFPHLTVAENVGFGLTRAALGAQAPSPAQRQARVTELLGLSRLSELADRMPHQLSGGQQQRVALVRALAPDVGLVLLDEPFTALDAALRSDLRDEVRRVLGATGATALLVTHDQREALSFADHLCVLREGVIEQQGRPEELYNKPGTPWVATFLGNGVLIDGVTDGSNAKTTWGVVRHQRLGVADGTPVQLLVRPEQVLVSLTAQPHALVGKVITRHYLGHETMIRVAHPTDPEAPALTARLSASMPVWLRDEVRVIIGGPLRAFPVGEG